MSTILISILIFGLLIAVHEAGHLVAAKLNNIKVLEYAIGMGPKLFSFSGKETVYSLRLLPIGGYCKIEGEDSDSDDERAICNKAPWRKFTVIIAGSLMNLFLGFIALVILFSLSNSIAIPEVKDIVPGTNAEIAGLMPNDRIIKINDTRVNIQNDITFFMTQNQDKPVTLTCLRNGEKITINVIPYVEDGISYIGFYPKVVNPNFFSVIKQSFYTEIFLSKIIYVSLGWLIKGTVSVSETSGPVGIVNEIGRVSKMGIGSLLYFIAFISTNLGIFNMLPFPALDGGRGAFCIWEMLTKKKVSSNVEAYVHAIGFLILLTIMIFVTFNDVSRLFAG